MSTKQFEKLQLQHAAGIFLAMGSAAIGLLVMCVAVGMLLTHHKPDWFFIVVKQGCDNFGNLAKIASILMLHRPQYDNLFNLATPFKSY